jgi:predicted ATPase/DNA-binding CsgD family transcriptional regulator
MIEKPIQTWIEPLNQREIEILNLISDGLSNLEISQRLSLSSETVKWYNKQMFKKLGVTSRTQAVKIASQQGILSARDASPTTEENTARSNLPAQLTSFVGRQEEVQEIKGLLKTSRLVVLTGPGGTGKTRLALQVAAELTSAYRDGVCLVELATIIDPALVANAIAVALKANPIGEISPLEVLKRFLRRKHFLLLLDNFEHLPEATPLVGELLAAAPQLTILATSRERLHVYGEQEYPVFPLGLPDTTTHLEPIEKLISYEAINLFVQRARAMQPRLKLSEQLMPAIVQICLRLDGLPLALELAASQVKTYPPPILAQQLEKSLGALPDGPRDLPARQRTLHATIEWSENLLNLDEKTLFARLAVFCGGGTLEAIERVCNVGFGGKIVELLAALVEKNLVITREGQDGELRFMMLETIHDYAQKRFQSSKESQEINRRHAAYYTDLAGVAYQEFRTFRQAYWFAKLRAEQDNLRTALAWSIGSVDITYALRLVEALRDHWLYDGYAAEGRRWCDLILESRPEVPANLLAGLLCTAGILAYSASDVQRGEELLRRSVELFRQSGDERGMAWALTFLAVTGIGSSGEIERYIEMARQSLETFRKLEDRPGMAQAYNILGELARWTEDYEAAQLYYEECLRIVQITGERMREAMQYENLGVLAHYQDQFQLAAEQMRRGLFIFRELGTSYGLAIALGTLAGPIARLGDYEKAARLLGAADAEMESLGTNQQPVDQIEIGQFRTFVREALGEEAFQEAWQAGHDLSIDEALEYALGCE